MKRTKARAREPTRAATATKKEKEGIESFHIIKAKGNGNLTGKDYPGDMHQS